MSGIAPASVRHLYDDALALLLGWRAPDENQEQLRRSFLRALSGDPMAVAKSGPPSHLTASCLVLSPDGRSVLLHLHARAGVWLQFGGHLESRDDSVHAAATRELREESGLDDLEPQDEPIDLDRHQLVGRFGDCAEHLDVRYLAVAPAGLMPRASEESNDIAWFPVDALPPNTAPDVARLISVGQARLG
ncbi:MAG: NUDIX hydrolase [Actinobacteria bacterium]|uniref:NUDIX hydrolase n=1 Tax=Nostocoides veronense TaxID=330836 RepID=A0ABP4XU02_9MICO|nr:NUDIX hydrolase [Actinomycetota bacterium]